MVTVDTYKDKGGEWKERAEWHRVTVWGEGSVKHLEKHGKKGALIDVLGQNRTRKWEANGVDHYSTEVVADFRAGGEVKITTLAKGAKERPEPDGGDREVGRRRRNARTGSRHGWLFAQAAYRRRTGRGAGKSGGDGGRGGRHRPRDISAKRVSRACLTAGLLPASR